MSLETVGVLGGTFDPVHLGHLRIADEARRRLGLSRMLLLPTAVPPHKPPNRLSPVRDRLEMLSLALEEWPALEISTLEIHENRVCYTIDTLRALRGGQPAVRPVFLLGMDSLMQIDGWRESAALLTEFDLVVIDRPDQRLETLRGALTPDLSARVVVWSPEAADGVDLGHGGRVFHLPLPPVDVCSSAVRDRAATGGDISDLVPPPVARYIERTGIYCQERQR